ncbi:cell surface protein SprA [Flammeovirgaceae bacterium SG7u.111]|nr:cell surface protein SprA [Flammeovirgaceae bacterium SG7u.132]WPO34342.1 cell surface protein SprA [Flammeovirgaceae bacterium SG7u.111]
MITKSFEKKLLFFKKVTLLLLPAIIVTASCVKASASAYSSLEYYAAFSFQQDTTRKDTSTVKPSDLPPYFRDRYGDPFSNYLTPSPLFLGNPSGIDLGISLDSNQNYYNISEKFGDLDYRTESRIPFDAYRQMRNNQMTKDYWNQISLSQDEQGGGANSLIPEIKLGRFANRLFGGDKVTVQPNGSVLLDFGGLWQRIENPALPIRQQRNGGFNFDQQIQMALSGKIGEKLEVSANFDTKNTFQFEQKYNIGYTAFEEDIIQEVQLGNVSFPVSNSLITGAQNLFGVTTKMRFGKLWLSTVFSSQRGSTQTLTIKNGAQAREFELRSDTYDGNRHFFLAHFFRDQFEDGLKAIPAITSGIVVTRVELYVTNRNNNTQTLRNIAGYMDLGEGDPYNNNITGTPISGRNEASNKANSLFESLGGFDRNVDNLSSQSEGIGLTKGTDFELLRGSRKLEEREYTFHPQLGFVSLVTPLRNDEILVAAFEYTYNGEVYKVGELTEDYQNLQDSDVIFLKLLSPSTIRTDLPTWDLMMKNIYSLQANQLSRENFQMRIIYRDDLTGIDNPSLHEGKNTKDVPLVQIMELDRLNPNNDPQPDGNFDFVEGVTIDAQTGRIMFPVLEPFGSHLEKQFDPADELPLINKYVFDDLYSGTQADAALNTTKNKFFMSGSYQSGGGNEIILPGINIAENSVVVRAGNTMLTEGIDYTVDYSFGRVRIINEGVLSSGKEIKIQYEQADLFNLQQRSLVGFDAEYHLTKDIKFSGTLLHFSERPVISRVSVGNEPTRNTLWGVAGEYRSESRLLTRLVDKIPFISTKEPSNVALRAEFAQIIPGVPKLLVGDAGTSYIDDFEQAEVPYDLTRQPTTWVIGSTPQLVLDKDVTALDGLNYNYKRAKLAWYNIDNSFYYSSGIRSRPSNITEEDMQNNYVRAIPFDEVFPNIQAAQVNPNEISFDLAYYPEERGAYNYNPDVDPDGTLKNPEDNFAAVTRAISGDVDFDNINIQYIEFWLMDPFIEGKNGRQVTGATANTGGELYFNLGSISEDVVPDERHFFENGLPVQEGETVTETIWGKVPDKQYLTNAFSVGANARALQDVGFDGLNSTEEEEFYRESFINRLPANLDPAVREQILTDPSSDDFLYYFDDVHDQNDGKVLERYKDFNGSDGNSPESSGGLYTASSSQLPDNEDLNKDNTVQDVEQYYQYKVELDPNSLGLDHPYVVDKVVGENEENGEQVNWYQFRIPIRDTKAENINGIDGFKSIKFMRMFLTGWDQPVVLRMVQFKLVGAQWRPFTESLVDPGLNLPIEPYDAGFKVTTVNIEENGQVNEPTKNAYDLPPGFNRDFDITSTVTRQLNEQSIQLSVENLQDQDSRAVFKNYALDLVQYKRLKMEVHAEDQETKDGEVTAFIRIGTDFKQNYYEIEVPLSMSPIPSGSQEELWPRENEIDVALEELYTVKADRNRAGADSRVPYPSGQVLNVRDKYRVTVVGNPDLSSVQTVMMGIRNPKSDDNLPKSVLVWFNELRVTEFNTQSGWATNVSLNTQLADFMTVSGSFRYNTVGFGGIQDKVQDKARYTGLDYDVSANINLDKFLFGKIGLVLPLFVSYEHSQIDPFYDPLNPDLPLDVSLNTINDLGERNSYLNKVRDMSYRKSINLTNVRKRKLKEDSKSRIYDIENLSLTLSYMDAFTRNINTESMQTKQWRIGGVYGFNSQAKPFQPFQNAEALSSPWLQLIKDFNLQLMPSSIAVRADLVRDFRRTQLRNSDLTTSGILPTFEKSFLFNRSYSLNWALSQNLGVNYTAQANALVDEPDGDLDTDIKRNEVVDNLKNFGRMKSFNQAVGVNYRLPLDKFPLTNWLKADTRYTASYDWTAGALGLADSLGNTVRNNNSIQVNGQVDLNKIYNSIPALKRINQPARRGRAPDDPLTIKRNALQEKLTKIEEKIKKKEEKAKLKEQKRLEKLAKQASKDSLKLAKSGDSLQVAEAQEEVAEVQPPVEGITSEDTIVKPSRLERKRDALQAEIAELDAEIERRKAEDIKPKEMKAVKGVARLLMSIKNINASYTSTNSTVLPGFTNTPKYFGFDENWESPGVAFLLGSQDPTVRYTAAENGWLAQTFSQNNPFLQNNNTKLSFQTNLEPVRDLKIQLKAERTSTDGYSEVYRWLPEENRFQSQTPVRTGTFGTSFFSLSTAFASDDENNNNPVFDEFVRNRDVIKSRLDALNPGGEYQLNSQDVLVPAFRAAYAGSDVNSIKLNAFPTIPIPNWQVTYSGLSKIPVLKETFRSVTLTHGYTSLYQVGNYTSSLFYNDDPDRLGLNVPAWEVSLPQANEDGTLVPVLVMNQVTISELFSPLIGIQMRTRGNVTVKMDFKKRRDVALNLSNAEVTELKSNDITVDIGYTKAGMKVPFKVRGAIKTLENDITMRMAMTVRDTRTLQRKIDDVSTVTAGNINMQFKPTISYAVNKQTQLTMYFERSINDPRISSSFKRSTTAFGLQLRYALMQ